MIITRTPLRISLGGGGTDLPSYYRRTGSGFLVAAAITKYVFVTVNRNFDDDLLLKYSRIEKVPDVSTVQHPILAESLKMMNIGTGVEITSMADIPTGTGLGSSGSFTVGVLRALAAHKRSGTPNIELAKMACEIEIERLREPVGKQDQYIAAVGGVTAFEFCDDERVEVMPLDLSPVMRDRLDDNLMLFFTGLRRSASAVLAEEQSSGAQGTLDDNLDLVKELGYETRKVLEASKVDEFGELLTKQWELKYERQRNATNEMIDSWIRDGIAAGARGGKLVGAGGGGFLLFYADSKADLRSVMMRHGLEEVRFGIDYAGSTTIVSD